MCVGHDIKSTVATVNNFVFIGPTSIEESRRTHVSTYITSTSTFLFRFATKRERKRETEIPDFRRTRRSKIGDHRTGEGHRTGKWIR